MDYSDSSLRDDPNILVCTFFNLAKVDVSIK